MHLLRIGESIINVNNLAYAFTHNAKNNFTIEFCFNADDVHLSISYKTKELRDKDFAMVLNCLKINTKEELQ